MPIDVEGANLDSKKKSGPIHLPQQTPSESRIVGEIASPERTMGHCGATQHTPSNFTTNLQVQYGDNMLQILPKSEVTTRSDWRRWFRIISVEEEKESSIKHQKLLKKDEDKMQMHHQLQFDPRRWRENYAFIKVKWTFLIPVSPVDSKKPFGTASVLADCYRTFFQVFGRVGDVQDFVFTTDNKGLVEHKSQVQVQL